MQYSRTSGSRVPRIGALLLFVAAASACNDLTEPLPRVQGTYDYAATSTQFPSLNRRGTLSILDLDRRTARFEGTFQYVTANGQSVSGQLIGAFTSQNRIWFRFLHEQQVFHEASFDSDLGSGSGEVFFLGLIYEPISATFTLRLR